MNFLKKCAAALMTGVMVLSCAACSSDTGWIMKKDELEMPAGVYLNNLLSSYYDAKLKVTDSSTSLLKSEIEGKKASEWIKEQALRETKINMALCDQFNTRKLSMSQDELMACQKQAESYYEQYGENLEQNGISKNTIELLYQLTYMKVKVFDAIYGEGGEQEVSESELRDYYENNYIKMAVQTFSLPQEPTFTDKTSEEEKATQQQVYEMQLSSVVNSAEDLYLQAQIGADNGKDWNQILNEYKQVNHETGETNENYDMTTDNYRLLDTATTTLNADVINALKEAKQGEVVKVRTDSMIAIGATTDLNTDPTDFEFVKDMIRHALKEDEFEDYLVELAESESFVVNQKAVDRYQPSKLKVDESL